MIEVDHQPDFFIFRPFGINDLGRNSRKIFEFKGLICKIFRNKDLGEPPFKVSEFQGHNVATRCWAAQIGKGCGKIRTLILIYNSNSIISSLTHPRANFSDFILSGDSLTYGENRENGGLTGFPEIELAGATGEEAGPPPGGSYQSHRAGILHAQGNVVKGL